MDWSRELSAVRIHIVIFIPLNHQTKKSRQTREFTDKICFKSFAISILLLYYLKKQSNVLEMSYKPPSEREIPAENGSLPHKMAANTGTTGNAYTGTPSPHYLSRNKLFLQHLPRHQIVISFSAVFFQL